MKRAQPAVVNVYASRPSSSRAIRCFDDPIFRRFFGDGGQARPGGRSRSSLGSGVIVDASGLVVTNYHVIEGMTEVKVALADKREFEAEIVLRDQRTDLAVLSSRAATTFRSCELGDSDALEVGDFVLAIGNPFGVGQTVTQGIVSALARTQIGISDYGFFIQTDAAINPGNSGGALVDMNGRLIGINSAIYLAAPAARIGIGFAIPVNMVQDRGRGRQERRQDRQAALARRAAAACRRTSPIRSGSTAPPARSSPILSREPGRRCRPEARRHHHRDRRPADRRSRRLRLPLRRRSRSAAPPPSPCCAAARRWWRRCGSPRRRKNRRAIREDQGQLAV